MNLLQRYCFSAMLFFLSFVFFSASAQNNNLTLGGKILDKTGKAPLEGATVHIKGTTHEVVTGKRGRNHPSCSS